MDSIVDIAKRHHYIKLIYDMFQLEIINTEKNNYKQVIEKQSNLELKEHTEEIISSELKNIKKLIRDIDKSLFNIDKVIQNTLDQKQSKQVMESFLSFNSKYSSDLSTRITKSIKAVYDNRHDSMNILDKLSKFIKTV